MSAAFVTHDDAEQAIHALEQGLADLTAAVSANAQADAAQVLADAAARTAAVQAEAAVRAAADAQDALDDAAEVAARIAADQANAAADAAQAVADAAARGDVAAAASAALTSALAVRDAQISANAAAIAARPDAATLAATYGAVRTAVKTAAYTAAPGDLVPVDTTAGPVTVTLPSAPVAGSRVTVKHVLQGGSNAVTVATGGTDTINRSGGVTSISLPLLGQSAVLVYATGIWTVVSADTPVAQLDSRLGQSRTGVYIPGGWGQFWAAARATAKAGTSLARVACVGDSLTVGQWASDLGATNWTSLLATDLQAANGDGGSGYFSTYRTATALGGTYTPAGLATLAGTWSVNTGVCDGPGASVIRGQSTGCSASFNVRGSTIEVFLLQGNTTGFGSYQVSIDGGAATTAATTNTGTQGILVRTFTGLSAGNHTVTVSSPDANASTISFFLVGVSGRNTAGVVVDNYGRGGFGSQAFNNQIGGSWVSGGVTYGGTNNGAYGPAGKWSGGNSRPADLVVYALGVNDARLGTPTPPDAYLKNARNFLDDVRLSNNGAVDVILLAMHAGTGTGNGGAAFEDVTTAYYANYVARLRGLADAYGAALVNVWAQGRNSYPYWNSLGYWGNSAVNTGAAGTDLVHLSNAGNLAIKNAVLPLLAA